MHCCKEYACTVLYIFETILSLSGRDAVLWSSRKHRNKFCAWLLYPPAKLVTRAKRTPCALSLQGIMQKESALRALLVTTVVQSVWHGLSCISVSVATQQRKRIMAIGQTMKSESVATLHARRTSLLRWVNFTRSEYYVSAPGNWSMKQALLCLNLSLIHIWRCRRYSLCRSRWSPYH